MCEVDTALYALFAQCAAAGLPLSNAWFANGMTSKLELVSCLREQLAHWRALQGVGDEPSPSI